jgi:hypothetical protein
MIKTSVSRIATRDAHAVNAPGFWKHARQLTAAVAITVGLVVTPAAADTGFRSAGAQLGQVTGELVTGPNIPARKKSTTDADVKLATALMLESILEDVPGSEASGLANLLVEAAALSQSPRGQTTAQHQ